MKQFLITAAGVFAGLLIFMIGVPFVLIAMAAGAAGPAPIPAKAVLELDLRDPLTDQSPQNALAALARRGHSAMSILEGLRQALLQAAQYTATVESGVSVPAAC